MEGLGPAVETVAMTATARFLLPWRPRNDYWGRPYPSLIEIERGKWRLAFTPLLMTEEPRDTDPPATEPTLSGANDFAEKLAKWMERSVAA